MTPAGQILIILVIAIHPLSYLLTSKDIVTSTLFPLFYIAALIVISILHKHVLLICIIYYLVSSVIVGIIDIRRTIKKEREDDSDGDN